MSSLGWQRYQIKIYDFNNNFKGTIEQDRLISPIWFTKNINGGVWEVTLDILGTGDIDFFDENLKLEIYEKDPDSNTFFKIFGWIINNVENNFSGYFFYRVMAYGYIVLFSRYILRSGLSFKFTRTLEASAFLMDVIDAVSAENGGLLTYDVSSIDIAGVNVTIEADQTTALDALEIIRGAVTNFYFYIDANGKCFFKPKSSTPNYILVKGRDIQEVFQNCDYDKIINHVVIEHKTWIIEVEDAISVSKWKRRTENIVDKEMNAATATAYATRMVNKYKDPIRSTKAFILSQYVNNNADIKKFNQLEPWQTCNIRNVDDENIMQNLQIYKVTYTEDLIEVEFEEFIRNIGESIVAIAYKAKKKIGKNWDWWGWSDPLAWWFSCDFDHYIDTGKIIQLNDVNQRISSIQLDKNVSSWLTEYQTVDRNASYLSSVNINYTNNYIYLTTETNTLWVSNYILFDPATQIDSISNLTLWNWNNFILFVENKTGLVRTY